MPPAPPPPAFRRAVIDVGTNSVKLLVANVAAHTVDPLLEKSKQTRLGRGFYETHTLQPEAISQTAEAVARYAGLARDLEAQSLRVIATSAARDANNADDLISAIQAASGLSVEILSGEQEADWVFHGVTSDPAMANLSLLILDVGGGSSEFILGEGIVQRHRHSYKLGTVRLLEQLKHHDPPGLEALNTCRAKARGVIANQIAPNLAPQLKAIRQPVHLVGTGGTATILARMHTGMTGFHREEIEAVRLSQSALRAQAGHLWSLKHEERQLLPGLPPKRADVILTGAVIYEAILEELAFSEMRVSTRGLRYAAIMTAIPQSS